MKKVKKEKTKKQKKDKGVSKALVGAAEDDHKKKSPSKVNTVSKGKVDKAELEATKSRLTSMLSHAFNSYKSRQVQVKSELDHKISEFRQSLSNQDP